MRTPPTLDPARLALLVIDMQEAFLELSGLMYLRQGAVIMTSVARVVRFCRAAGMTIVWTRMSHELMRQGMYPELFPQHFNADGSPILTRETPGYRVHPALGSEPGDVFVDKSAYSAFEGTGLESILRDKGRDTVVIVGIATNVCCDSTARDAFARGFRVITLSDATATGSAEVQAASLKTLGLAFGYVMSSEDLRRRISGD
jgi:ureidoacrylate peracid hydrolase